MEKCTIGTYFIPNFKGWLVSCLIFNFNLVPPEQILFLKGNAGTARSDCNKTPIAKNSNE